MSTKPSLPDIAQADIDSFAAYLNSCKRVLALCGAGLSASSGLPTFRGAGGYWRAHDAISLATPGAFSEDPALVWQFYNYRRHMSLKAKPNPAHYALAELCRKKSESLVISQNVDGLSQRAKHPPDNLALLHGSLSTVRCTNYFCNHVEHNNFADPIAPALDLSGYPSDISDPNVPLRDIPLEALPHCPECKTHLLRPGVVWFGETLPSDTLQRVDQWMADPRGIDLIIVIGTSAMVYPAAGYIMSARTKGAKVAVVNMERPDSSASRLMEGDWFFGGDAGEIVPRILEGAIGKVEVPESEEKL